MNERKDWIDSLKGVSILFIMLIHLENYTKIFNDYNFILCFINRGNLGVELTYLLNSYLLINKYEKQRLDNCIDMGGVLMNSIIRIIPLYYLALFIFIIFAFKGIIADSPSFINIISHFTLISFVNPIWWGTFAGSGYMGVLVLCWILLPLYYRFTKDFSSSLFGMVIVLILSEIAMFIFGRICLISDESLCRTWINYIFRGFESFSVGVFIYFFRKKISLNKHLEKKDFIYILILNIFYLVLLCYMNVYLNVIYLIAIIPFVILISYYPTKVIVNPITKFLGKYIFGIYFSHILLYFALKNVINNSVILWLVDIFLSIFCAWVFCNTYEKIMVKHLRKLMRLR